MSKTNKVLFSLGISFNIVGALCILFSFIDDTFLCVATIPPTTKNVFTFIPPDIPELPSSPVPSPGTPPHDIRISEVL